MEKEIKLREKIYVICGKSAMRKGIDGLAAIATEYNEKELFDEESMFLFCGGKKDRYKALYWEKDGSTLLYKRIEKGKLKWLKEHENTNLLLNHQQYRWLLEGLSIFQAKAVKQANVGHIF